MPTPADALRPVLVKLGGSLLTRKRGPPRLRPKVLARLAREIVEAAPPGGVVLLHGAGSFGHPGAHRFHLAEPPGADGAAARARGAAIVSAEVRRLHGALLGALLEAGGRPWSLPASLLARQSSGRLEAFESGPFRDALASGLLPVSFGDVVPDREWGFSILSADTIAVALARPLAPERMLFVSDVPGVYRVLPGGRERAEIYPRIEPSVVDALIPRPGAVDVTGGIRGKARAMVELGRLGVVTALISGLPHGAVREAVRGAHVYGSWSGPGDA